MRIIEKSMPKREEVNLNQEYTGKIVDYAIKSFQTKRGTPGYSLKLKILPDAHIGPVYAFDFIGYDENGPYILRGSKMEGWLKTIFGAHSLENVILENVKGRQCKFKVVVRDFEAKDKETGNPFVAKSRDVVDFYQFTPVPTSTTKTPPSPSKVTEEDWGNGELL